MARKKTQPVYVEPEEESQVVEENEPIFGTDEDAEIEEAKSPGKAVNKSQAARAAIDAGYEKPGPAFEYIKTEFGIDMNPQHFSAIKSNYRKKQEAAAPTVAETPAPGKRAAAAPTAPASKAAASTGDPGLLTDLSAVKHLVERLGADQVRQIVDLFE